MKNLSEKISTIFFTTSFSMLLVSAEAFAGATSAINPVSTCTDLQNISAGLAGQYALTNDIDCTGVAFSPIGSYSAPFTGALYGNGYAISYLYIDAPNQSYVGLFGATSAASITDLILNQVRVAGQSQTGALVGEADNNTQISGIWATGEVKYTTEDSQYTGGLVGLLNDGSLSQSSASVWVLGSSYTGGLIGGIGNAGKVSNSYSMSKVQGGNYVGGLAGTNSGTITNVYSAGQVLATDGLAGGLVAVSNGQAQVNNSYWDTQVSEQSISAGGTGESTAAMHQQNTYNGWDFTDIWDIGGDYYPWLR